MKRLREKSGEFFAYISGSKENIVLEHQCFNSICFLTAGVFFITILLNYLIGLPREIILTSLLCGIFFAVFFYLSRFRGFFKAIYWLVLLCGFLFVSAAWFYTGGISGTATIITLIIIAVINLVATGRRRLISICILSLYLGALYWIEFAHPGMIVGYDRSEARFVDNYLSFLIAVFLVSFVIYFTMQHFRSERNKVEESEEKLKAILDNIPDLAWLKDSETRYTMVNQPFCDTCGMAVRDIVGKTAFHVWPPPLAEQFRKDDQKILSTGEILRNEENLIHWQEGEKRYETIKKPIIDQWGEITGIVGIARDITDKKEMEKRLLQSEKMEAVGTLAGGIAHDFNNILSGIMGYAQLGKYNLDRPDKLDKQLDQIVKGSERAGELVQQILTFSRQRQNEKRPLKAYVFVKEALKLIRATIPTFIEIEERIDSEAYILADPAQLHQIVTNLCTNAYQSMLETRGTLTVILKDAVFAGHEKMSGLTVPPGRYIELSVADTGQGMDRQVMEKIFEPYFTTKAEGKGTGLGLSLVHGIVEDHGGVIGVESEPGRGSCFRILFPVIDSPGEADRAAVVPEPSALMRGSERILIVDDEKSILFSTGELLSGCGYEVSTFLNPKAALAAFIKEPDRWELMVTDMNMPQMTGDELALEVMAVRPGFPVILCTGYSDRISEERARALGIRRFIQKPLVGGDLTHQIRRVLEEAPA